MKNETLAEFLDRVGITGEELNLLLNFVVTASEVFAPIMRSINDADAKRHYERIQGIAARLKESQIGEKKT
jgi:hypothetical protein